MPYPIVRRILVAALSIAVGTVFSVGCARPRPATIVASPATALISPAHKLRESVGIETLGGVFTPLLDVGCDVPCTTSQSFSTAADNQRQILIHLYSGHSKLTSDAKLLGNFEIGGISPMPLGTPLIDVTFSVEDSGVVLTAADRNGNSRLTLSRKHP